MHVRGTKRRRPRTDGGVHRIREGRKAEGAQRGTAPRFQCAEISHSAFRESALLLNRAARRARTNGWGAMSGAADTIIVRKRFAFVSR